MANLTNRQIISDVVNDLRALNLDDKVSRRFILHKLRDFAGLFIKRDADSRRLLNISDLWTDVDCVELTETPMAQCCHIDIPGCTTMMKSNKKIPETYETLYKELLQVFNPFYAKEFRQTDPQQYKNIINREYVDKRLVYFWLSNKYLIIPNTLISTVMIRGVFISPADAKKISSCAEAESDDGCISTLDQPFVCPDYLLPVVKQETLKDLFNFYKRNVLDESPNLNTNIKATNTQ